MNDTGLWNGARGGGGNRANVDPPSLVIGSWSLSQPSKESEAKVHQ